ncbi:hypothetical protein V6N12_073293 [Hibiscus sabdariffa]|uniref:Uncharacterized protein n=1 Tax=Hibiscus sabdariffa TaxID=183260 RepID=A0ABR2A3J3_9ROSI
MCWASLAPAPTLLLDLHRMAQVVHPRDGVASLTLRFAWVVPLGLAAFPVAWLLVDERLLAAATGASFSSCSRTHLPWHVSHSIVPWFPCLVVLTAWAPRWPTLAVGLVVWLFIVDWQLGLLARAPQRGCPLALRVALTLWPGPIDGRSSVWVWLPTLSHGCLVLRRLSHGFIFFGTQVSRSCFGLLARVPRRGCSLALCVALFSRPGPFGGRFLAWSSMSAPPHGCLFSSGSAPWPGLLLGYLLGMQVTFFGLISTVIVYV